MEIKGIVHHGVGQGAFFTQLAWVVRQCEAQLGWTPFPGTLNLHVPEGDRDLLRPWFAIPTSP
jgi:riboflavin kinase